MALDLGAVVLLDLYSQDSAILLASMSLISVCSSADKNIYDLK